MAGPGDYVVIAKITTVYGVKGWVKVHSFTDPLDNFLNHSRCFYRRGKEWKALEIVTSQRHGKGIVAQLAGVDDRDAAREFCGVELAIASDALPSLEEGEYYWHQLIGLKVYTHQGGMQLLGEVSDLMETGANDVLVVKACQGSIDKQQRLVPYLPGQFVERIDLQAGEMLVDWDPAF